MSGILNKIKYGAIIAFVLELLRQSGFEVPTDVESAINTLIASLIVLVPWVAAFFIKESKETVKALKISK